MILLTIDYPSLIFENRQDQYRAQHIGIPAPQSIGCMARYEEHCPMCGNTKVHFQRISQITGEPFFETDTYCGYCRAVMDDYDNIINDFDWDGGIDQDEIDAWDEAVENCTRDLDGQDGYCTRNKTFCKFGCPFSWDLQNKQEN